MGTKAAQDELVQWLATHGLQTYFRRPAIVEAVQVPFAFQWEGWISDALGYIVRDVVSGRYAVMDRAEFEGQFDLQPGVRQTKLKA